MTKLTTPATWPENEEPKPEQLADWLEKCTHEELVEFARRSIHYRRTASQCFREDHVGRLHLPERPAPTVMPVRRDRAKPSKPDGMYTESMKRRLREILIEMEAADE